VVVIAPLLALAPGAGRISIDLDRLVGSRALIQAGSGGGKSRALRYLLEQTHGHIQQIVIDPEGEFSSLREKFDYLLAAKDGDVPAEPRSARLLCRRIMELGVSAVIDIYDLKLPKRREFVRLFLDELVNLPRSLWRPLMVAIDEAHMYAPERGQGEAESLDAVIALCTLGRKRGFCPVLATQRLSKLHKDAAAELNNKLIGLTGLDVDLKRAADELGFDKEQRNSLRNLLPGHFYAFGPAIGAPGVSLVRTGEVLTTHPEPGQVAPPPPPAPAAIAELVKQLQDLPAQAEEEARSVEDLQLRVRSLESDLRKARQGGAPDPTVISRAVEDATRPLTGHISTLEAKLGAVEALSDRLTDVLKRGASPNAAAPAAPVARWTTPPTPPARRPEPSPPLPTITTRAAADLVSTTLVSRPQQKILDALATYESFGEFNPEVTAVAMMAGYRSGAGHWNNLRGSLGTAGWAVAVGGRLSLTESGRALAHAKPIKTLADLHQVWLDLLEGPQRKVLTVLLEKYPNPVKVDDLAEAAGYTPGAGHFNNVKGSLSTLGALVYPARGYARASQLLFPKGLSR
jgi:hypothetical protein